MFLREWLSSDGRIETQVGENVLALAPTGLRISGRGPGFRDFTKAPSVERVPSFPIDRKNSRVNSLRFWKLRRLLLHATYRARWIPVVWGADFMIGKSWASGP